ncbi:VPLPA-CTERM sorting domain-containing protein [Roseovarius sp. D22-M7]|uniref:VPLPA-CTERM sorting domain-containing protein n=1 Tax=Roseovarius sp. D22-M7 TaxID=3127116 RepID=UPI0030104414
MNDRFSVGAVLALTIGGTLVANDVQALTLGADFAPDYSVTDLGAVPGLPRPYGGLTLLAGTTDTLLIGGNANRSSGRLYSIGVNRDATTNSITGFNGTALQFGDVGEYNDGGVTYGPGGVLFTAQWNVNNLGQTRPGSTDEDRVDDLAPFGVGGSSIAAITFVPPEFAGAGKAKIVSWSSGNFYDIGLSPDGSGTFDIDGATQIDLDPDNAGVQSLPGGPEGFVYIDDSNAGFFVDSMLVSDFSANRVSAYELDGDGNPLVPTRRDFLTGLSGAEGAFIDPVTGDFLFSTFGGGDRVVRVDGFIAPPPPPGPSVIPLPAAAWLLLGAIGALLGLRRRQS